MSKSVIDYIIYIPGLGDHYDKGRLFALWFWRVFGVKTQLVPMRWYGSESYESKLKRVKDAIKAAQRLGYRVSLIGESAGASMVLNAAIDCPNLHCISTLAGVNSSNLPISPYTKRRAPAFSVSAQNIASSLTRLDSSRVHTIHAAIDSVVSPKYNDIPGATNHRLFSVGHIGTIILCLTILSFYVVSLVKRNV